MKSIFFQFQDRESSSAKDVVAFQILDDSDNVISLFTNEGFNSTDEIIDLFISRFNKISNAYLLVSDNFLKDYSKLKSFVDVNASKIYKLNHPYIKDYFHIKTTETRDTQSYVTILFEKINGTALPNFAKRSVQEKLQILLQIIHSLNISSIVGYSESNIQQTLQDYIKEIKELKLTNEQIMALNVFDEFIRYQGNAFFILTGSAGTGKSTLVKYMLEYYKKTFNDDSFILMAPTGKAARVMENKTKISCATIHKSIYNYKYSLQESSVGKKTSKTKEIQTEILSDYEASHVDNWDIIEIQSLTNPEKPYSFVVVDEASMATDFTSELQVFNEKEKNEKLYNRVLKDCTSFHVYDLISYLKQLKKRIKIVFVGDHCQLPPISTNNEENFIPALNQQFLRSKYSDFEVFTSHLQEAHRFANQEVYLFSLFLRNKIESIYKKDYYRNFSYNFNEVYHEFAQSYPVSISIFPSNSDFLSKAAEFFLSDKRTIIITFRNNYADYTNFILRKYLKKTYPLEIGDKCISVKNNYNVGIMNGEHFTVTNILDVEFREAINFEYRIGHVIPFFNADIQIDNSSKLRYNTLLVFDMEGLYTPIDLESYSKEPIENSKPRRYKEVSHLLKFDFKSRVKYNFFSMVKQQIYNILVKKRDGNESSAKDNQFIDIAKRCILKYNLNVENFSKEFRLDRFIRDFQQEYKTLLLERLPTDRYLNAVVFKHGYAITCHKAQGSEWEKVFITDLYQRNLNWLYTAVTRSSDELFFCLSSESVPKILKPFKPFFRIIKTFSGRITNVISIELIEYESVFQRIRSIYVATKELQHQSLLPIESDLGSKYVLVETENDYYFFPASVLELSKSGTDFTRVKEIEFEYIGGKSPSQRAVFID